MPDTTTVEARLQVPLEIYVSLGHRPDRVRECVAAAASKMDEVAAERGRRISETPRLVEQGEPSPILNTVELTFHADTVKR